MHCNDHHHENKNYSRRDFLTKTSLGLGALSLGSLISPVNSYGQSNFLNLLESEKMKLPHFIPKAKRVIYLFQSGAPSQLDLFDYKPKLNQMFGKEVPKSILGEQRLTGMSSGQNSFPMAGTLFNFNQHGESGAWMSDLMPYTAKIVDELCFIKSMYTNAINHDPAITMIQTGSELPGRPSIGYWLSYGLGTDNKNLPEFVVLVTKGKNGQPIYSRLWGNGFLPSQHQGVQFRSGKDAVLYLENPPGVTSGIREEQLKSLKKLQSIQHADIGDPEILTKISNYEMAYRMQTSVPEVMDVSDEPQYIFDLYGEDSKNPGTFAANCLLARKLAEKDVKFIQLYHRGWDQHGNLPRDIKKQAKKQIRYCWSNSRPKTKGTIGGYLSHLGRRVWPNQLFSRMLKPDNYGRDHHPVALPSLWLVQGSKKESQLEPPMILVIISQNDPFIFTIFRQHLCTFWGLTTKN